MNQSQPYKWQLIIHALVVLVVLPVAGQSPPSPQTQDGAAAVAAQPTVVTLPVTVRDKHGKIVHDLTKDDFTLQEDGHPQTIRSFSQQANQPLTIGLLVDTSPNQGKALDAERNASRSFLDQMLVQPTDKAFLIHFDRQVELLQDVTSSHEKLKAALDLLQASLDHEHANDPNDPANSPSGSDSHGSRKQLYDAVFLAANELMKKQQGRKVFIILSDGVDHGSRTYLESAIESAQRGDTVIYSIYSADTHRNDRENQDNGMGRGGYPPGGGYPGGGYPGGGYPGGGYPGGGRGRGGQRREEPPSKEGQKNLQRISKETGGRFFEASKKETVGEIYDSIVEELRAQFAMVYTPDKGTDAQYHHVQLTVKKKDMTVQTREGYYPDR
ncbi:MAG: VWA domain-containing protein [Terriglobales bacterium]